MATSYENNVPQLPFLPGGRLLPAARVFIPSPLEGDFSPSFLFKKYE
jgi:hypothetical protein